MLAEYFPWVEVDPSPSRATPAMAVIAVGYRPSLAVQCPSPPAPPAPDCCLANHSRPRSTTRDTSGSLPAPRASPEGAAKAATSNATMDAALRSITNDSHGTQPDRSDELTTIGCFPLHASRCRARVDEPSV